jgi:hypothetical protein
MISQVFRAILVVKVGVFPVVQAFWAAAQSLNCSHEYYPLDNMDLLNDNISLS